MSNDEPSDEEEFDNARKEMTLEERASFNRMTAETHQQIEKTVMDRIRESEETLRAMERLDKLWPDEVGDARHDPHPQTPLVPFQSEGAVAGHGDRLLARVERLSSAPAHLVVARQGRELAY